MQCKSFWIKVSSKCVNVLLQFNSMTTYMFAGNSDELYSAKQFVNHKIANYIQGLDNETIHYYMARIYEILMIFDMARISHPGHLYFSKP